MKTALLFSVLTSLSISFAHAGPVSGSQTQTLSFEQLKESCTNPQRFHNQIPPRNIVVRCDDVRTIWVPSVPHSFNFQAAPEKRSVKTSLISDKYHVNENIGQVPLSGRSAPCPVFDEYKQNLSLQKKVTCDELLAHQGSLVDFCLQEIEQKLEQNADILNERPTGRRYTLCQGQVVSQNLSAPVRKTPTSGSATNKTPQSGYIRKPVTR